MTGAHFNAETRARVGFSTKVTHALKNPNRALAQLNYDLASGSLIDFAEVFWPVIEPGRPFVKGWAIEAVCEHLEAVTAGQIKRLLINVPPGLMKSLSVNVLWPAWEWGPKNLAANRFLHASYNIDLMIRDNRRCRQIIESPGYQEMFGDRYHLVADQNAKIRYDNDKRGFKIALSVDGGTTGERGDRFVFDDPHNVKKAESEVDLDSKAQWFTEVVPTRINDLEESAFIGIMQRVHERDLSGLILAAELGYTHLCLPMEYEPDRKCFTDLGAGKHFEDPRTERGELLFPERFGQKGLDVLKKQLSSWGGQYAVSGQLQQSPTPRGGGMFKVDKEKFKQRMVDVFPPGKKVRGWDIAGSITKRSPFTASVKGVMRGDMLYVGAVTRERKEIEEAEDHIYNTAASELDTHQDLPQDPGSAGKSQKRHMGGRLGKLNISYSITPESGDKATRAIGVASLWNNGNVVLVGSPAEAWVDPFLAEIASFPRGEFKDQVDALSRMYARLLTEPTSGPPEGGEEVTDIDTDDDAVPELEGEEAALY
jgi:predicted phage terminase large subunit-like protein